MVSHANDSPYYKFTAELDELLQRWARKPADDRPTNAEVVGALHVRITAIGLNVIEDEAEEE